MLVTHFGPLWITSLNEARNQPKVLLGGLSILEEGDSYSTSTKSRECPNVMFQKRTEEIDNELKKFDKHVSERGGVEKEEGTGSRKIGSVVVTESNPTAGLTTTGLDKASKKNDPKAGKWLRLRTNRSVSSVTLDGNVGQKRSVLEEES